ncbi:histidine kinase [Streptacidiphilus sp. N1-12]|uniref:Histidine kinase n=2 Tax=Streptacidiphilus alkalitolerans TaxID=3342712 RepID=A0ABV6V859_9ACTN
MATTDMGAVPATAHQPWRTALRLLGAPFSRWAWQETGFIAAGVPLALPAVVLLAPKAWHTGLPVCVALLLLLFHRLLTRLQRDRFRALLGLEIPAAAEREGPLLSRATLRWLRSDSAWRQLGYHLVAAPLLSALAVAVLAGWTAGLVLATVFGWAWAAPTDSYAFNGQDAGDIWITAVGLVLLLAMPWAARLVRRLDGYAAAALLGPNRARELARRVESLAESRSGVVDAADAERRRIERDLHDGAQQRLVSLAVNLGLAKRTLRGLPPEQQAVRAMEVIDEAHLEAQAAIAELRDLVRGLHPVVLEDRGLDAALSGIAARAPLPVRLVVELPGRADPAVEAVAYFVVSEALANIAKHARASRAEVAVRQSGTRIVITVADDGVGGADPARGTGLAGLRQRAASVDGSLAVTSPLGGPTVLTVELPCAL